MHFDFPQIVSVRLSHRARPAGLFTVLLLSFGLPSLMLAQASSDEERARHVDRESLDRLIEAKSSVAAERPAMEAKAERRGLPVRRELADGSTLMLQGFDGERPIYRQTENLTAAETVSTDQVRAGGSLGLELDGSGERVGIWDAGLPSFLHQELNGRVEKRDFAFTNSHSSHVACTMAASGVNPLARGMASAVIVAAYDSDDDTMEMAVAQGATNPIKASNHSYGVVAGWGPSLFTDDLDVWYGDIQLSDQEDFRFGFYDQDSADWDAIAYDSPYYLIVHSAGNDRNDVPEGTATHWHYDSAIDDFVMATDVHPGDGGATGYDTMNGSKCAKNILTVGAVDDIPGGWTEAADVVMSTFSNWGPTDDGRIKPDLVANGISLLSCVNGGSYSEATGTSMAAPNVTGSLALLHQHSLQLFDGYLTAATMKALVLHTASEAGNPGPDYIFGWGLLNTAAAADVMSSHAAGNSSRFHLAEEAITNGGVFETTVASDGHGPLAVTLAWTDPAGQPLDVPAIDSRDRMLVNDLDLRLIGPELVEHLPWVLDPVNPSHPATFGDNQLDPVEQVWIEAPVPGVYTLRVSHKATLTDSDGIIVPQSFSLVVSGNTDTPIFADGFESGDLRAWE